MDQVGHFQNVIIPIQVGTTDAAHKGTIDRPFYSPERT